MKKIKFSKRKLAKILLIIKTLLTASAICYFKKLKHFKNKDYNFNLQKTFSAQSGAIIGETWVISFWIKIPSNADQAGNYWFAKKRWKGSDSDHGDLAVDPTFDTPSDDCGRLYADHWMFFAHSYEINEDPSNARFLKFLDYRRGKGDYDDCLMNPADCGGGPFDCSGPLMGILKNEYTGSGPTSGGWQLSAYNVKTIVILILELDWFTKLKATSGINSKSTNDNIFSSMLMVGTASPQPFFERDFVNFYSAYNSNEMSYDESQLYTNLYRDGLRLKGQSTLTYQIPKFFYSGDSGDYLANTFVYELVFYGRGDGMFNSPNSYSKFITKFSVPSVTGSPEYAYGFKIYVEDSRAKIKVELKRTKTDPWSTVDVFDFNGYDLGEEMFVVVFSVSPIFIGEGELYFFFSYRLMVTSNYDKFFHMHRAHKLSPGQKLSPADVELYDLKIEISAEENADGAENGRNVDDITRLLFRSLKAYHGGYPRLSASDDRYATCLNMINAEEPQEGTHFCANCFIGRYWDGGCRECPGHCYGCKSGASCSSCVPNPFPAQRHQSHCLYGSCFSQPLGASYVETAPRCDWCGTVRGSNDLCSCNSYSTLTAPSTCKCNIANCKVCYLSKCDECETDYFLYKVAGQDPSCLDSTQMKEGPTFFGSSLSYRWRAIECRVPNCVDCVRMHVFCDQCSGTLTLWREKYDWGTNDQCITDKTKPGYGKDTTKTWVELIKCHDPNCENCDNNYQICESCMAPYFKKIDVSLSTVGCVDGAVSPGNWPYRGFGFDKALQDTITNCLDQNCDLCVADHTKCTECKATSSKKVHWDSETCVQCQGDGVFVNGNLCSQCSGTCKTCGDSTDNDCLSCPKTGNNGLNYLLSSPGKCVECTADRKFKNENGAIWTCDDCPTGCADCGAGGCTRCLDPNHKVAVDDNNSCKTCSSSAGYFVEGNFCKKCDGSCLTCRKTKTECLTCDNGAGLFLDSNLKSCVPCLNEPGRWVDEQNNCQNCHNTCKTCKGPKDTDCTSCENSSNLVLNDQGRCILDQKQSPGSGSSNNPEDEKPIEAKKETPDPKTPLKIKEKSFLDSSSKASIQFTEDLEEVQDLASILSIKLYQDQKKTKIVPTQLQSAKIEGGSILSLTITPASDSINQGILVINLLDRTKIRSKADPQIYPETEEIEVGPVNYFKSEAQEQFLQSGSTAAQIGVKAYMSASFVVSASTAFALMRIIQMLGFMTLINVKHPRNLTLFLELISQSIIDSLPNFLTPLSNDSCQVDKKMLVEEDISCYISLNLGNYLIYVLAAVVGWAVLKILSKLLKSTSLGKYLEKPLKAMNINFWLDFMESVQQDVYLNLFVSLSYFRVSDTVTVSNFLASILLSLGCLSVVGVVMYLIRTSFKMKKDQKSLRKVRESHDNLAKKDQNKIIETGYEALFEENKDSSVYQRQHRGFNGLKDLAVAFCVVIFHDFPVAQTLVLLLITLSSLIADIVYLPYKKDTKNYMAIFRNSTYVICIAMFFILSLVEDSWSKEMQYYWVGYPLIAVIGVLILGNVGFGLFTIYRQIKSQLCKKAKEGEIEEIKKSRSGGSMRDRWGRNRRRRANRRVGNQQIGANSGSDNSISANLRLFSSRNENVDISLESKKERTRNQSDRRGGGARGEKLRNPSKPRFMDAKRRKWKEFEKGKKKRQEASRRKQREMRGRGESKKRANRNRDLSKKRKRGKQSNTDDLSNERHRNRKRR